ncbi:MAG: glycosyltransferase [Longimicrobiales bacterium]
MNAAVLIHRVIARLNVGGPAMHVVNLTRALNGGPWRTRLIAGSVPPTEEDMSYYAAERGVEVTLLPEMSRELSALDDVRSLLALWRLFRRERPTVVHTHTAKAGTLGRLAAILAGVPVRVHTFHGHVLGGGYFAPWKTRLFLEIERQLARGTSRLVVLTRRQAREMSEELGVAPPEKFAVVPLGLELERFGAVDRSHAARTRMRAALGIPEGARAVGIVGRVVPIKNHELFLEALAADKMRAAGNKPADPVATHQPASLLGVVVGSGEREAELKALAARLGVGDRVVWLGWRRDLADIYGALDALALPSHDEGTPVAVLEALAAGLPVVARDVGGVGEVLSDVGAGTVLPREAGAEAWAAALTAAVEAPAMDRAVRDAVVARFSVERLARDLAALYREEGAWA